MDLGEGRDEAVHLRLELEPADLAGDADRGAARRGQVAAAEAVDGERPGGLGRRRAEAAEGRAAQRAAEDEGRHGQARRPGLGAQGVAGAGGLFRHERHVFAGAADGHVDEGVHGAAAWGAGATTDVGLPSKGRPWNCFGVTEVLN